MPSQSRHKKQESGVPSTPPTGDDLSPDVRADLLDPAIWREGLATYARSTGLAVALTDTQGRLLGEYISPQPTWDLLHANQPAAVGGCPFSLSSPCACVVDALARDKLALAHGQAGLAHFAVPLSLDGRQLGALVAGQVFDQYPEQLPLEQIARKFGVSPQKVWHTARLEHPVKRATLEVYGDLLATLGNTFLLNRYHAIIEATRLAEMTRLRDVAVAEITERRRAEAALREADRRKDEFLAMLAHELRNPLAPITTAVEVMRLREPHDPGFEQARETAQRQVRHMARLIDDLLDVSRITRDKIRLQKKAVELATVVARAVETSRPLIDARRHELRVALPQGTVWLEADPVRLAQVLANLLNNAAKYTGEGGRIWLTAEAQGGEVAVRVRDTGMGIAAEMLPHVFDLFTQADRSLDRSQGGLGIGLTLARRLVEMHGGSVQAFSNGPGQGSEFVIRLPVLPEAPPTGDTEVKDHEARAASPPRRILVVDDNLDSADILTMLLKLMGHEVLTVYDGPSALAAAPAYRPEIVFLDIGLPEMDGYEVARRLREFPELQQALLVAVTGYGRAADRRLTQEAGFDHHLVKPVDDEALQSLLDIDRSLTT